MGLPDGYASFQRAAEEFAAQPNHSGAISDMMHIAFEGKSPILRCWAARWLSETCNISVVTDKDKGQGNAASPEAEGIL